MLEDLIISRVRLKVLGLFFENQDNIFYVREIVRKVKEEINAVRRELSRLEKTGLLRKEWRANRLYYGLKKTYPFYYDLLALIAKTTGLGEAISKNRNRLGKPKFIMLSGKFIRGLTRKSNQVDLLVVGEIVLPELARIVKEEEAKLKREINYTVMTCEEFNFRKERRDPFILDILSSTKVMIIGDEEELVEQHGTKNL